MLSNAPNPSALLCRTNSTDQLAARGKRVGAAPRGNNQAANNQAKPTERSRVNALIAKEMRIREGAKNMLRAIPKTSSSVEQRALIKVQLCQTNANISELHLVLQGINSNLRSNMQLRGHDGEQLTMPSNPFSVIALPLKEGLDTDLAGSFTAFVELHYHEEKGKYAAELADISASRQAMRNASLSLEGRDAILSYFGKLLQAEHRFFQEDKCADLVFNWFDSFDGQAAQSKSIRLEKASVLFNAAAMCSQLAAMEDCNTAEGLEQAIGHFQTAAGILQYIREENFFKTNVSTDVCRSSVSSLSILMLAQAQECIWHAQMLKGKEHGSGSRLEGAEAAAVADWYASCRESLAEPLLNSLPAEWSASIEAKELLFKGIADWHAGSAEMVHSSKSRSISGLAKVLRASKTLAEASAVCHRDVPDVRIQQMTSEYRQVVQLVVSRVNASIVDELMPRIENTGPVHGKAARWSTGSCDIINEWTQQDDLFARMGPVYFFNSMCALVERRKHAVKWNGDKAYGLTTSGGNPVRVSDVVYESPAHQAGLLAGDYIISVNGVDARCMVTADVEALLARLCADEQDIEISIVVNYDMQNFEELINPEVPKSSCARSASQMLPMPQAWGAGKFDLCGKTSQVSLCELDC